MVKFSFRLDACSLFLIILITQTLESHRSLLRNNPVTDDEINYYVLPTKLYMKQNCSQIEHNFYEDQ